MKKQWTVTAAAALAAGLAGCGSPRTATVPPSATALLIDQSVVSPGMRQRYAETARRVIWDCEPGAVLKVYGISDNSLATAGSAFRVEIPLYDPLADNPQTYRDRLEAVRRDAFAKAEALMAQPASPATDVLGAFQPAASFLEGGQYGAVREKRLVLLSDMVHQTRDLDFLSTRLTRARSAAIIGGLRERGEMPSLPGVRVWVAGIGSNPPGAVAPAKMAEIERFWLADFRAMGADLAPDRYGATLDNYGD